MIRFFDLIFSFLGLLFLSPILLLIFTLGLFENGSPIFKQKRVGYDQNSFLLLKFRSMKNTKSVATHLINNSMITLFGFFLRRTKLDEFSIVKNVFIGDMSLVITAMFIQPN